MFQESQSQAAKDKIKRQPPSNPVIYEWKHREAFWTLLYGHLHPEHQPRYCVLSLEEKGYSIGIKDSLEGDLVPNTESLTDGSRNDKIFIHPLVDYIRDEYEYGVDVILSQHHCWLAESGDATGVTITHRLPPSPSDPKPIAIPRFFAYSWESAARSAESPSGYDRAVGTVLGYVFVLLFVVFAACTLFGIAMIANSIIDWLYNPIAAALENNISTTNVPNPNETNSTVWGILILVAIVLNSMELLIFFPPLRWWGWGAMLVNFALHTHFGWSIGAERGDSTLISGLWALVFALISTVPDTLTLYFGGLVIAVLPLIGAWLPQRILEMAKNARNVWRRESEFIQQNANNVVTPYVVPPRQLPYR